MAAGNDRQYAYVEHLQQGTDEWLKARRGQAGVCVGSSLLGAVAGMSQFKRPYAAYRQLVTGESDPSNAAMAHGHACEKDCAQNFERMHDCALFEAGIAMATERNPRFTREQRPFYAGSIDRWGCGCGGAERWPACIDDHMGHPEFFVVECKCPASSGSYRRYYAQRSVIKDEHLCQLHLQMALFGLDHIYYTAALLDGPGQAVRRSAGYRVHWSEGYWKYALSRADVVVQCALDAYYGGKLLSEDELLEELGRGATEGAFPPLVRVETLW